MGDYFSASAVDDIFLSFSVSMTTAVQGTSTSGKSGEAMGVAEVGTAMVEGTGETRGP